MSTEHDKSDGPGLGGALSAQLTPSYPEGQDATLSRNGHISVTECTLNKINC